jgi:hypothetical protein
MLSVFLPEDIILLILSYGDVYVTQKMEDVLFQLKYHLEIFDEIRNKSRFFKTYNPCAGYTIGMFYRSMLLNKKKKIIHWIPPSMKYWILSSSSSGERLYKYSISDNSSTTGMYINQIKHSECEYDSDYESEYISHNISTTERYQINHSMSAHYCDYISGISQWTSIEYISEYIPEPEKPPYEFIPFKRRYARCMGEPYKGGKGYGKYGRGNYSKRGNKKH